MLRCKEAAHLYLHHACRLPPAIVDKSVARVAHSPGRAHALRVMQQAGMR